MQNKPAADKVYSVILKSIGRDFAAVLAAASSYLRVSDEELRSLLAEPNSVLARGTIGDMESIAKKYRNAGATVTVSESVDRR